MNSDELLGAFITAGLDTPEKVQAVLTDLATNLAIKRIDIELDGLGAKQADALKPILDHRNNLISQRNILSAQLNAS